MEDTPLVPDEDCRMGDNPVGEHDPQRAAAAHNNALEPPQSVAHVSSPLVISFATPNAPRPVRRPPVRTIARRVPDQPQPQPPQMFSFSAKPTSPAQGEVLSRQGHLAAPGGSLTQTFTPGESQSLYPTLVHERAPPVEHALFAAPDVNSHIGTQHSQQPSFRLQNPSAQQHRAPIMGSDNLIRTAQQASKQAVGHVVSQTLMSLVTLSDCVTACPR